jgi:hypothetical protein
MKVYNGTAWVNAAGAVNGTAQRVNYTATAGQTTFAATYDVGFVDVYLNGIKLINATDFTATNGTSIVLTSGATLNDTVDIVAYGTFDLVNFSINDASDVNTSGVTNGQVLVYNSTSNDFEAGSVSTDLVDDTSPQLGGSLDCNGNAIVSTSNQNINIIPDGVGDIRLHTDTVAFPTEAQLNWPSHRGTGHDCTLDWQIPTNDRTIKLPDATGVLSHVALARTSGTSTVSTVNITGLQTYPFLKYVIYFKLSLNNASLRFRFLDSSNNAIFAANTYQWSFVDNGTRLGSTGATEMNVNAFNGVNNYDGMVGRVEVLNVQALQDVDEIPASAILGAVNSRNGTTTQIVNFAGGLTNTGVTNNPNGIYGLQFKSSVGSSVINRHDIEVYGVKTWTS